MDVLDMAIDAVCQELTAPRGEHSSWEDMSEEEVFREVAASILGSNVSFEMASAATERLAEEGLLRLAGDERSYLRRVRGTLSEPLSHPGWNRSRRYRFPTARSGALAATALAFYSRGGTIKNWLSGFPDGHSARRGFVEKAAGVGPKQASLILRNIRFCSDLAILDTHVLRFMQLRGLVGHRLRRISNLVAYESIERRFLDYAHGTGWPAAVLDLAVWVVMRVCPKVT